jgi:hypothetical protein
MMLDHAGKMSTLKCTWKAVANATDGVSGNAAIKITTYNSRSTVY